jgi:hypothetical protein
MVGVVGWCSLQALDTFHYLDALRERSDAEVADLHGSAWEISAGDPADHAPATLLRVALIRVAARLRERGHVLANANPPCSARMIGRGAAAGSGMRNSSGAAWIACVPRVRQARQPSMRLKQSDALGD